MTPNRLHLVFALLGGVILLVALTAVILLSEARRRDLELRVVAVATGQAGPAGQPAHGGLTALLRGLGERIRRGTTFYSDKDLAQLQGAIVAAGLDPKHVLPVIIGAKALLMVLAPGVAAFGAYLIGVSYKIRLAAIGGGLVLGIMGPEWILGMLRRSYLADLQHGIPDGLDLLVVCSEAGMGLESALERVSGEMFKSNRPIALALAGLLDDLRVLPDRREALANFGTRSGVEGLQRLATVLAQTLQYGTPLSQALRAVAIELRRDRMNKLEEKAAKLPAKLILPMIICIMPCLYIILVGSAFLRLYDAMGTFMAHLPSAHTHIPPPHH